MRSSSGRPRASSPFPYTTLFRSPPRGAEPHDVPGHVLYFQRLVLFSEGAPAAPAGRDSVADFFARSEEHTSELQSLGISYAVFCLKKKTANHTYTYRRRQVERRP